MLTNTGDLWTYPADLRVITTNAIVCNGKAVMGRGIALQAKQRYPGIEYHLAVLLTQYGNRVMRIAPDLASFPTKHDWRNDSDITLIQQSAVQLAALANKFNYHAIVMPPPGCGNGHLQWHHVQPIIAPFFDDRFTVLLPRRHIR